eukprot:TRINITY_DN1269_c0_g5_i1.p1 TRINITY_DN1269_c0_g5~~TRINITY_DN1269_c0_g5_i1.p1  ORF type:complete len:717 (+),score=155.71 TRINITY_DN1269_c0_g5_i1:88-2238(+)
MLALAPMDPVAMLSSVPSKAAPTVPPPSTMVPAVGVGSLAGNTAALRSDPAQLKSVRELTDSLVTELEKAQGIPDKALMRELLSRGIRRALDFAGPETMRKFLEALSVNIHKFPMQEQQSLARVYPVEISSEYRNLQSFVLDAGSFEDDGPDLAPSFGVAPPPVPAPVLPVQPPPPALGMPVAMPPPAADATMMALPSAEEALSMVQEVRDILRSLPAEPSSGDPSGGVEAQDVLERLTDDEEFAGALRAAPPDSLAGLYSDLRLNIFKFSEEAQKELVEAFPELRLEIGRLVESMAQEISRWLDEERASAVSSALSPALIGNLKALLQAVVSKPYLAAFGHLDAKDTREKNVKENFLLKVALCLRTYAEKRKVADPGADVEELATKLRMHFFFVQGYGELMDAWLDSRIRQFNDDFLQRASAVLASNLTAVSSRLRRTLRPGRWTYLVNSALEDDLYALFLDEAFPRHVLSCYAIGKLLKKVSAAGGGDFHVYCSICRAAPPRQAPPAQPGEDPTERALVELLQRFPPYPPMRRVRPGLYLFGQTEVEFVLRGPTLWARVLSGAAGDPGAQLPAEQLAEEFFNTQGPLEYPAAADLAAQAPVQPAMGLAPTAIVGATPGDASPPGAASWSGSPPPPAMPASFGVAGAPPRGTPGGARYEPYPAASGGLETTPFCPPTDPRRLPGPAVPGSKAAAPNLAVVPGLPPPTLGVEDDEI